jgi:hypothetical protein
MQDDFIFRYCASEELVTHPMRETKVTALSPFKPVADGAITIFAYRPIPQDASALCFLAYASPETILKGNLLVCRAAFDRAIPMELSF